MKNIFFVACFGFFIFLGGVYADQAPVRLYHQVVQIPECRLYSELTFSFSTLNGVIDERVTLVDGVEGSHCQPVSRDERVYRIELLEVFSRDGSVEMTGVVSKDENPRGEYKSITITDNRNYRDLKKNKVLWVVRETNARGITLQMEAPLKEGASEDTPNPASFTCKGLKGKSVAYVDDSGDTVTFCSFGQALVEEWTLWKQIHETVKPAATQAFLHNPENPGTWINSPGVSSRYCEFLVGKVIRLSTPKVNGIGGNGLLDACRFEDGSMMEVETFYRGPNDKKWNSKLTEALNSKPWQPRNHGEEH